MPRDVIYTCLFGRYEELNDQPVRHNSEVDFICFTDRADLTSDSWQVRRVPTFGIGAARESRRSKLMPHSCLGAYDRSCYIDASVQLKARPEELFSLLDGEESDLLCIKHPWRDCTFDEAEEIIRFGIDDEVRVREQMSHYRRAGLPLNAGLVAGTFLLRRHNVPGISSFGETWFEHVLRFSKRDQLSFPFVSMQYGLNYKALDLDLLSNWLFSWPVRHGRIPYNFDPEIYLWLHPDVARAGVDPTAHYLMHGRKEGRRLQYHRLLDLTRIANRYSSDKGNLHYNRHFYTRVYEHYLRDMRESAFTLFEIGLLRHDVQARNPDGPFTEAPSLKMWEEYFPNAEIHGFDIQDFSSVGGGRITFTQGDQSDRSAIMAAMTKVQYPLNVVIDDGSHASHHQQIALSALFRELAPGGLYFIEDLHYQPAHLERTDGEKTLDVLRNLAAGKPVPGGFLTESDLVYLRENIASIQFHDSMDYEAPHAGADALAVIRKR